MTILHIRTSSGAERSVDVANGLSVMEALRPLRIGIDGECEGSVACATCHVWIDESWMARVGEPSDEEADMLDCAFHVRPTSRLSCQIKVTPDLDGLGMTVPG